MYNIFTSYDKFNKCEFKNILLNIYLRRLSFKYIYEHLTNFESIIIKKTV